MPFDPVRDAVQNTPPVPHAPPASAPRRASDIASLLNSSSSNNNAPYPTPRAESPPERLGSAAGAIRRAGLPPLNTRSTPVLESPGGMGGLFTPVAGSSYTPHPRDTATRDSYFPPSSASPVHQRMPPPGPPQAHTHVYAGVRVLPPAHNLDTTSSRSRPSSSHSASAPSYNSIPMASPHGHPAYAANQSPVFQHHAPVTQRVSFERGGSERPRSSSHGSAASDTVVGGNVGGGARPGSGRGYEGRQRSESERAPFARFGGTPDSPGVPQGYVRQRAGSPTPGMQRGFVAVSPQDMGRQPTMQQRQSDPPPHPSRRPSASYATPPPGTYANRKPPSPSSIPPMRRHESVPQIHPQHQQPPPQHQQPRTPVQQGPPQHHPHATQQPPPPQQQQQQQPYARRPSTADLSPNERRALSLANAQFEAEQAARVRSMSMSMSAERSMSNEEMAAMAAAKRVYEEEERRRFEGEVEEERRWVAEGEAQGRVRARESAVRDSGRDDRMGRSREDSRSAPQWMSGSGGPIGGPQAGPSQPQPHPRDRPQKPASSGPVLPSSSGPALPAMPTLSGMIIPTSSGTRPVLPFATGPTMPIPSVSPVRRSPPATDRQPARKRARREEPEREAMDVDRPSPPPARGASSSSTMPTPTSQIPPPVQPQIPPPIQPFTAPIQPFTAPIPPPVTPANHDAHGAGIDRRPPSPVKNVQSAASIARAEADATPTPHPHHPHPNHAPQRPNTAPQQPNTAPQIADGALPTRAPHVTTTTTVAAPAPGNSVQTPTSATPTPTSSTTTTASGSTPTPTMNVPPPMSAIPMPVMPAQPHPPPTTAASNSRRNPPPLTAANLPVPIVAAGKKPPPVVLSPVVPARPFVGGMVEDESPSVPGGAFVGGMVEDDGAGNGGGGEGRGGGGVSEERVGRGITRRRKTTTNAGTAGMVHPLPATPQPLSRAPSYTQQQQQPSRASSRPPSQPQPQAHTQQPQQRVQTQPTTRPYNPRRRTPATSVMIPLTSDELAMYRAQLGRGTARLAKRRRALDEFEVDLGVDDGAGAGVVTGGGGSVNGGGGGGGEGGGAMGGGGMGGGGQGGAKGKRSKDVVSVVEHYNARPNQAVSARQLSPIIGLRNFNNWIKSVLISAFALPALQASGTQSTHRNPLRGRVLDVGCGKGGDLSKWHRARIAEYVGLDIAAISVNQAKERHNSLRPPKFDAFFGALDCFTHALERAVPAHDLRAPFDVVSLQFCMHYAFESEGKVRRMLENVAGRLRVGGRVVGTVPNDELLLGRLADGEKSWGNSVCRITFEEGESVEGVEGGG
ncbi:unnamed protein product, partial [Peniophora sp. CBMAI 1063]